MLAPTSSTLPVVSIRVLGLLPLLQILSVTSGVCAGFHYLEPFGVAYDAASNLVGIPRNSCLFLMMLRVEGMTSRPCGVRSRSYQQL